MKYSGGCNFKAEYNEYEALQVWILEYALHVTFDYISV